MFKLSNVVVKMRAFELLLINLVEIFELIFVIDVFTFDETDAKG